MHNPIFKQDTDCYSSMSESTMKCNWIAIPRSNYDGNPGSHRTWKPMANRVSCCNHSPHLNIPRSFKIFINLILEHSSLTVYSINLSFVEKMHCIMSSSQRSLANAQLCPRVLLSVLYFFNIPLSKASIPCVILKTYIWSPRK